MTSEQEKNTRRGRFVEALIALVIAGLLGASGASADPGATQVCLAELDACRNDLVACDSERGECTGDLSECGYDLEESDGDVANRDVRAGSQ